MQANRNNSGCWPGKRPAKVGHHVDGCDGDMEGATSGARPWGKKERRRHGIHGGSSGNYGNLGNLISFDINGCSVLQIRVTMLI